MADQQRDDSRKFPGVFRKQPAKPAGVQLRKRAKPCRRNDDLKRGKPYKRNGRAVIHRQTMCKAKCRRFRATAMRGNPPDRRSGPGSQVGRLRSAGNGARRGHHGPRRRHHDWQLYGTTLIRPTAGGRKSAGLSSFPQLHYRSNDAGSTH